MLNNDNGTVNLYSKCGSINLPYLDNNPVMWMVKTDTYFKGILKNIEYIYKCFKNKI